MTAAVALAAQRAGNVANSETSDSSSLAIKGDKRLGFKVHPYTVRCERRRYVD
jgi:hypothetical protein